MEKLRAKLLARKLTIATAESLTAGLISSTIASVSGSSAYHYGGIVAYNIDMKVSLLDVDRALAESCNCVSPEIAVQMAQGAQKYLGADIILAATGYAEPPEHSPTPYAWVTVLKNNYIDTFQVRGDKTISRNDMRALVTSKALEKLLDTFGD